jgi:cytoskeletal protein CcmA (bactofilin family)
MVFNRRQDPLPPESAPQQIKRPERPVAMNMKMANMTGHNSGLSAESVIGSDLSIEGQTITIRCKGALKVNGNIQADLHCKQIEVGREAIISGSISADEVNVLGRVNGAILGQKVVLHASAEVEGDIHSQYLSIEHGAAFDGRSRRVTDPAEIAPQLERQSGTASTLATPASAGASDVRIPVPPQNYS